MSRGTRLRVGTAAELPPGTARRLSAGDRWIAVFNAGGTVLAVDDRCPHEGGRLSLGSVEAGAIRCPVHGACFDLRTGRTLEPPAGEPLTPALEPGIRVYPVRVIGDELYVDL
ncbi:MAG: non-heme iron oxygenase ferredoxin subunit [Candidatus Rokubacteria bacterium]|nr:non-heme iron oxygenase ferredoxin subunit [Candidatus Rokubacteria bacterium]